MKRRWLIVLVLATVGLLAGILYVRHTQRQTYYQGKPVKSWAKLAASRDPSATAALKALGSNAVPDLIKLLRTQDSSIHQGLRSLVPELPLRLRGLALKRIELPFAAEARGEAARSLGIIGPEARAAVPALAQALQDTNHQVCYDAANAMARIGKDSVPALTDALRMPDPNRRHSVIAALAEIGPEAETAVPALIEQLKDPDPNIREAIAYALPRIGPPGLLALLDVIEHGTGAAREVAAKELLLFRSSPLNATPALLDMARDEAPGTRHRAIETLAALHSIRRPVIDMFIAALKDPIPEVRVAAIKALVQSGTAGQRSVPSLTLLLEDKEESVRLAAKEALQRIQASQPGVAVEKTGEAK